MSGPDDYMLTAEEVRLRRLKRRRIIIAISVALLSGVLAFFSARPTLSAVRAFQARRHAARAFAYIEEGKWNEAREESLSAYRLRASEPQALRAVARYLSRTGQRQALDFWPQLEKLQPLTRDDLRDEAAVALVSGEAEPAAAAIDRLLADHGKLAAPLDWLLAARLALHKGSPQEATADLRKIFENPKASEREQLQAALLELQSAALLAGDAAQPLLADAWSRITKISAGKDESALDALLLLAQRQLSVNSSSPQRQSGSDLNPSASSADLIHAIENHPLARAPQKLLCLDLLLHDDPSQKQALIDRAIAQWKDADAPSLVALATWLNGKGEYQRELDTIPLERAAPIRELFLQHLDALGALGRWADIQRLLEGERFPLDPVVQHMYLARCYAQLEQKTASENRWRRALEAAGNDLQKLLALAEYAEKNGANEIAQTAYTSAASEVPKLRVAQRGRLRTTYAGRDTRKIHAVLTDMLRLWPNDTALQNDEAYIRLLLLGGTTAVSSPEKEDVPAANPKPIAGDPATTPENISAELTAIEKLAADLVKREPTSLPHRTLLALARLKQYHPQAALTVYADIQITPGALSPSALAVHAAILTATGDTEAAKAEARQIPDTTLLPEEHALVEHLRE